MTQLPPPLAVPLLDDPAETFHRASRMTRLLSSAHFGAYAHRFFADPEIRFSFGVPTAFSGEPGEGIDLRRGAEAPPGSVVGALRARRSTGEFASDTSFPASALAAILDEAAGVTAEFGRGSPSAGGLYPIDCFVAVADVEGIPSGFYGFHPFRGCLIPLRIDRPVRAWLEEVVAYRITARTCAAVVFVAAAFDRVRIKYGQRGYRFALLEAGHLAQSMLLVAAAEGVGACPLGGYFDDEVDRTLGLNGVDASVIYSVALGSLAAEEER